MAATQKNKRSQNFGNVEYHRSKKAMQRYIDLLNYYRYYIPRLAYKLNPSFQLLKTTENKDKIIITPDFFIEFCKTKDGLDKRCQSALRQPLPDKHLVSMTDASFQAAGNAVLAEDDPDQKFASTRKSYAPVTYGSKFFTTPQIQMSIPAIDFLAKQLAFKDFGYFF